jgi:hypothetical protein
MIMNRPGFRGESRLSSYTDKHISKKINAALQMSGIRMKFRAYADAALGPARK